MLEKRGRQRWKKGERGGEGEGGRERLREVGREEERERGGGE